MKIYDQQQYLLSSSKEEKDLRITPTANKDISEPSTSKKPAKLTDIVSSNSVLVYRIGPGSHNISVHYESDIHHSSYNQIA